jgi:hypothetical protein
MFMFLDSRREDRRFHVIPNSVTRSLLMMIIDEICAQDVTANKRLGAAKKKTVLMLSTLTDVPCWSLLISTQTS